MSDFEVRFATKKEAAEVANLHLIASRAAYAGQVPEAHWDATPMAKRVSYWKEAIEYGEPQVLVALEGDSIVGFVGYDRSRDPKSKNTTGEIWAIYADPDRLGEGVGLALWDAAREGLLAVAGTHLAEPHLAGALQGQQALARGIEACQQRVVGLGLIHQRDAFIGLELHARRGGQRRQRQRTHAA